MDGYKKNERTIVSTEDQIQVTRDCEKMLEAIHAKGYESLKKIFKRSK